jgi:hypothetical protein
MKNVQEWNSQVWEFINHEILHPIPDGYGITISMDLSPPWEAKSRS